MKKIIILVVLATVFTMAGRAQMELGILPPEGSQPEQFTEWKKVEFTSGSETFTYEYKIAFKKRKALACYWEIVVKNTSAKKIKFKVKSHYYDRFVKGNFGEEAKETVKPGKEQSFVAIQQGCKADKEKKDQPDMERCRGCDFSYDITPEVD